MKVRVIYFAPKTSIGGTTFSFALYQSNSNLWTTGQQSTAQPIATGGGALHVGANTFTVNAPGANLAKLYLAAHGSIQNTVPPESIFVAEPPQGHVSDADAFSKGPPWIALAGLAPGVGIAADLFVINGTDTQAGSAHPYVIGAWSIDL